MFALWFALNASAYDPDQPEVVVLSVPPHAIDVDGVLDEAAWATAAPATQLLRHRPSKGGPPPCPTEVRFLQDDRYLYVGARVSGCDYPIRARIGAREQINEDDQIGVYLDSFADGRSGYLFYLNPHGVQQDIRQSNGEWSFAWNAAFTSRGNVTDDGYEIEIAFPWRSLKYPSGQDEQTWGVVITRVVPELGAKYSFPQVEDGHPRVMTLAAPLVGVRPPRRGSGLELIPGVTAGQGWPREDGSTTGLDPWHQVLRPSFDLRYGVTPDLGFTAAVNPDFSQVEADVPDVRVNPRFAFQFSETRPLFLDGFEYYQDRSDTLYTRSVNEPLYGVKLSGREGPVSVGVLHTIDRSPLPTFHFDPTPTTNPRDPDRTPGFEADDVAGRSALVDVVRARLDAFGDGFVGVTWAEKRMLGEADRPARSAGDGLFEAVGADLEAPLGGRWRAGGSTQQTAVGVAGEPLTWGMKNEVGLQRVEQFGTGFLLFASDRTPGHRLETGFAPQSGVTSVSSALDHNFSLDAFVDTVQPGIAADAFVERDGDRYLTGELDLELQVADVHGLGADGGVVDQVEQGTAFRGWFAGASYEASPNEWVEFDLGAELGTTLDYGLLVPADFVLVELEGSLMPITWLRLDTLGSYERLAPDAPGPAGAPRSATLLRNRLNLQFTRELGVRVIEAWTDDSEDGQALASSVLFTWFKVPGTAAYLGFSDLTDLEGGAMVERSVFAKVSVLLRP